MAVALRKLPCGMQTALEFAMEFRDWADRQHAVTVESIRARWGVSRATAYRWIGAYRAVTDRKAA